MVNFSNADFDPKKEFTSDVAGPSRRRNNPVGWLQVKLILKFKFMYMT